jgi:hypothetical protein
VIDLANLIEHLLHLGVGGQALTGLINLVGGLQEERLHLAFGKATIEVKERAVLGAAHLMAVAVGLATFHISLDQGGVEEVGRKLKGA